MNLSHMSLWDWTFSIGNRKWQPAKSPLLGIVIVIVLILAFGYFPQKYSHKLLSQPRGEYDSISVSAAADGLSGPVSVESEKATSLFLYLSQDKKALKRTDEATLKFVPFFTITVEYTDGKTDVIYCMPEKAELDYNQKWYLWRDNKRYFVEMGYYVLINDLRDYWTEWAKSM